VDLDLQIAVQGQQLPRPAKFRSWLETAATLARAPAGAGLCLRIVEAKEIQSLNARYRGQDKPTNVLSFPLPAPPGIESAYLGDVLICAELVAQEAAEQGKHPEAHWAHLAIHGLLHLLDYDHQDEEEAERMEQLETQVLRHLGYPDPYTTDEPLHS
jgi:probable rRNA maturation factor